MTYTGGFYARLPRLNYSRALFFLVVMTSKAKLYGAGFLLAPLLLRRLLGSALCVPCGHQGEPDLIRDGKGRVISKLRPLLGMNEAVQWEMRFGGSNGKQTAAME